MNKKTSKFSGLSSSKVANESVVQKGLSSSNVANDSTVIGEWRSDIISRLSSSNVAKYSIDAGLKHVDENKIVEYVYADGVIVALVAKDNIECAKIYDGIVSIVDSEVPHE